MPIDEFSITLANKPMPVIPSAVAQEELRRMKSALVGWLKYRSLNDAAAAGAPSPSPLLRRPGAAASPPRLIAQRLLQTRSVEEAKLASNLHALLSEFFDAATLPSPDLARNPQAAVELAQIAIAGKLPGEAHTPSDIGFIWLWPAVIVVGAIAYVITSKIRNDAEEAMERERLQCIKEGRCTDTGFWMKVGAVGVIGWLLWDKVGIGERVSGRKRRR